MTPSNAQFNAWRCTSTSPYLFTAWCLKLLLPLFYLCSRFPFGDTPVCLVLLEAVRCVISIRSVCRVRVRFESIRLIGRSERISVSCTALKSYGM